MVAELRASSHHDREATTRRAATVIGRDQSAVPRSTQAEPCQENGAKWPCRFAASFQEMPKQAIKFLTAFARLRREFAGWKTLSIARHCPLATALGTPSTVCSRTPGMTTSRR